MQNTPPLVSPRPSPNQLYIDLVSAVISNTILAHKEMRPAKIEGLRKRLANWLLVGTNGQLMQPAPLSEEAIANGTVWSSLGMTMIGMKRIKNLQRCVEDVIADGVPGDFIETGVWRGGATILMRAILKACGVTDRVVWVADSFDGVPRPDAADYPADSQDVLYTERELAVSLEDVQRNFRNFGLLDNQVKFLKGWFRDTLPTAPIERLAVVRLDGDMYESTMDGLVNLYHKLSVGGYLIVDDFGAIPACRQAVEDFRSQHKIVDPIKTIDWTGVFWKKATLIETAPAAALP